MHLSISIYPYKSSVYSGDLARAGRIAGRISAGQVVRAQDYTCPAATKYALWVKSLCSGTRASLTKSFVVWIIGNSRVESVRRTGHL